MCDVHEPNSLKAEDFKINPLNLNDGKAVMYNEFLGQGEIFFLN